MEMARFRGGVWAGVGFLFIAALLAYHVFGTSQTLSYPWWYEQGSDGDGTYVTQSLALINNGKLTLVCHPGATTFSIHGGVYRILALFFKPYQQFLRLDQAGTVSAVFDLLDLAMRVSRIITYSLIIVSVVVFWKLLYQLCKSRALAYFLSIYFVTTPFMRLEWIVIRPEVTTFIFGVLMFSIVLYVKQSRSMPFLAGLFWGTLAGVLAGLAMFAKMQGLPQVFFITLLWVFSRTDFCGGVDLKKLRVLTLATAVLNILIMPWVWLNRPALLTDAYMKHFYPGEERLRMYGNVPDNVSPLFWCAFGILLFISLAVFFIYRRSPSVIHKVFKLNLLVTGIILSCYLVFLPLGMDFASYAAASNHLLYSIVTNMTSGAYVNHRVLDGTTLRDIWRLYGETEILGFGLLWLVMAAAAASVLRIFLKGTADHRSYCAVLLFFAVGFLMDTLASLRRYTPTDNIISSYEIFSLPCYLMGLGLWLSLEAGQLRRHMRIDLRVVMCVFLAMELADRTIFLVKQERQSGQVIGQTLEQEMRNTISQVEGFWEIASQGQL